MTKTNAAPATMSAYERAAAFEVARTTTKGALAVRLSKAQAEVASFRAELAATQAKLDALVVSVDRLLTATDYRTVLASTHEGIALSAVRTALQAAKVTL